MTHSHENKIKTKRRLNSLSNKDDCVFLIYYSCEDSSKSPEGKSPRITTISIRNFATGKTKFFSIHQRAEILGTPLSKDTNSYDEVEREMLADFFKYMREHSEYTWVHWHMRDINYGFDAINHRYEVLTGQQQFEVDESKKIDLTRTLSTLYGESYIHHPRLKNLVTKNRINDLSFLDYQQEAIAFESNEFIKLSASSLRKVEVLAAVLSKAIDNDLKTDASWVQTQTISPKTALQDIAKHWSFTLTSSALGIIAACYNLLM